MNHQEKARSLLKELREVTQRALDEKRDLTPSESAQVANITERAKELKADIKDRNVMDDLLGRMDIGGGTVAGDGSGKSYGSWAGKLASPDGQKAILAGGSVLAPAAWDRSIVADPLRPRFIHSVIPVETLTGTDRFSYLRQTTRTNNAAPVAPGALKPTSVYTVTRVEDRTRVIAHLSEPIARQDLEDAEFLRQFLESELRHGLLIAEDAQIVNGNGTGENLTGLLNASGIQTHARGADDFFTALRKSRTKVETKDLAPDALILNPVDAELLDLLKNNEGDFYGQGPTVARSSLTADGRAQPVWSMPVVISTSIPAGTQLLGAFKDSTKLYVRSEARVDQSENIGDQFARNQVTFRCESRIGLAVTRPFGLVKITA